MTDRSIDRKARHATGRTPCELSEVAIIPLIKTEFTKSNVDAAASCIADRDQVQTEGFVPDSD